MREINKSKWGAAVFLWSPWWLEGSCDGRKTSPAQDADENFALACVCHSVSHLLLRHRFGAFHAPCGSSLFCFGCAALRVTVSLQILFGKNAEKISPEPPQMQSFGTWEHGPLALLVPRSRSGNSTNGDNHVPEQSNPHRLSRQQPRSSHQQRGLQRHNPLAGNQVLLQ